MAASRKLALPSIRLSRRTLNMEVAMTRMIPVLVSAVLLVASHGVGRADETFEKVAVTLEQTVQDEDSEIRFDAVGRGSGLAALKVVAPDGRTVIDFRAPDSKLGLRQISLESPEPKNNGALQTDFPEGAYRFTGKSVTGVTLQGEARLSHKLPDATSLVRPKPDEKNVPVAGLQIRWSPVKNLAAWIVLVEHEATGRELRVNLPATATALVVPDGFLVPGTEYKLAIGAVAKEGNKSFVETNFTTATSR
jgi:hypothetical protein